MKGHHRPQTIRALIGLALGLGAAHLAYAASLGPIQVNSYMGQPLKAAIRVNGLTAAEAQSATVTLADSAEYSKRGVVRTPEQSSLAFRLVPSGNAYTIAVSSNGRMNEPFVNFVLSFRSGGEVLTREYSVFLDPDPAVKAGIAPAAVAAPAATANAQPAVTVPAQTAPMATAAPKAEPVLQPASADSQGWGGVPAGAQRVMLNGQSTAASSAAPVASPAPAATAAPARAEAAAPRASSERLNGDRYGPVRRGETLFSIANATRPSGVSAQTMMKAIFNANRRAFANSSMDSLMAGHTLVIPSNPGEIAAQARSEARESPRREAARDARQAEAKTVAQIADTIAAPAEEEGVRPVEMTAEQIAEAEAQAAKLAQAQAENNAAGDTTMADGAATEPVTEEVTEVVGENSADPAASSAMLLDDADSINNPAENMAAQDTAPAVVGMEPAQELPSDAAADTAAMSDGAVDTSPAAETAQNKNIAADTAVAAENASEPAAAQPSASAADQSAAPQTTDNSFFGLPLWALGAIGTLLAALLALALSAALKKRKAAAAQEMSEEEIEALAQSMSEEDEKRLAALINEDALATAPLTADTADLQQSDYDREFFSSEEPMIAPSDEGDLAARDLSDAAVAAPGLNDLDDFFTEEEKQATAAAQADEDEAVSFEGLDDFFGNSTPADSAANVQTAADDALAFDGLDDFFNDAPAEEEQRQDKLADDLAAEDEGLAFEGLDDFFTDDAAKTDTAQATEDNFSLAADQTPDEIAFDDLDNLLAEETPNPTADADLRRDEQLGDLDAMEEIDFFADPAADAVSEAGDSAAQASVEENDGLFADLSFTDEAEQQTPADILNLGEPAPKQAAVSAADVQAMSINLDLAAAYINSGIKPAKVAKVRTWLEEVLEKGNAEQQQAARELLGKLD